MWRLLQLFLWLVAGTAQPQIQQQQQHWRRAPVRGAFDVHLYAYNKPIVLAGQQTRSHGWASEQRMQQLLEQLADTSGRSSAVQLKRQLKTTNTSNTEHYLATTIDEPQPRNDIGNNNADSIIVAASTQSGNTLRKQLSSRVALNEHRVPTNAQRKTTNEPTTMAAEAAAAAEAEAAAVLPINKQLTPPQMNSSSSLEQQQHALENLYSQEFQVEILGEKKIVKLNSLPEQTPPEATDLVLDTTEVMAKQQQEQPLRLKLQLPQLDTTTAAAAANSKKLLHSTAHMKSNYVANASNNNANEQNAARSHNKMQSKMATNASSSFESSSYRPEGSLEDVDSTDMLTADSYSDNKVKNMSLAANEKILPEFFTNIGNTKKAEHVTATEQKTIGTAAYVAATYTATPMQQADMPTTPLLLLKNDAIDVAKSDSNADSSLEHDVQQLTSLVSTVDSKSDDSMSNHQMKARPHNEIDTKLRATTKRPAAAEQPNSKLLAPEISIRNRSSTRRPPRKSDNNVAKLAKGKRKGTQRRPVDTEEEIETTNWWHILPYAEIRKFLNTIYESFDDDE